MPDLVSLVRWRDAKADPPKPSGERDWVMLDGGWYGWWTPRGIECTAVSRDDSTPVTRTDFWAEWPRVPSEGALTLDHLTCAVAACELVARDLREASDGRSPNVEWYEECAARLRRAIEQAEGTQ